MRTVVFKMLDRLIGPAAVWMLPRPASRQPERMERILLIRPGGIGDAVLLIPAIQAMKKMFPSAVIHVLAETRNVEVFSLSPEIERVFRYDSPAELVSVIRGHYDAVIDTEQWHRLSAVVARLVRAPMSIGFSTNERKKLFTQQVAYSHNEYEADSFLHLVEPLVGRTDFDPMRPFLLVPAHEASRAKRELQSISGKKIVVLFPGGSIAERQWGSDRFHAVAEQLYGRGYGVVVIGGKGDFSAGEEVVRGISGSLNLCGRLSLAESAAVLKLSSLLITGDSGILHVGYGLGIKIVALFGPGIEKKWAPRSPHVAILNKHLACSPCTEYGYTPECEKNVACMSGISIREVTDCALAQLDKD